MPDLRRPTNHRTPTRPRRPRAEALEARCLLSTIVVDSAGDADGADGGATLSLRQAIEISNGTLAVGSLSPAQAALVTGSPASPSTIDFAIPGTGPFTIAPTSALPAITSPVTIDGYSEPGAHPDTDISALADNAVIQIALNGSAVHGGSPQDGLSLDAAGVTVRGLAIGGFASGAAIALSAGPGGDLIQGNFLGIDATGGKAVPNDVGIRISGSSFDTIGGTATGAGNVISGNLGDGIQILSISTPGSTVPAISTGVKVEGNSIGDAATVATGVIYIPNGGDGISIVGGDSVTIGGTAAGAGNLIRVNRKAGVAIQSSSAAGSSGPVASNGDTISGNSIFGNSGLGIDLGGDGVTTNVPGGSDTGPNRLQPYPVIVAATPEAGGLRVAATLDAAPSTAYTIEFFLNPGLPPPIFGQEFFQGYSFLGSTTATTDASGHAAFTFLAPSIPVGDLFSINGPLINRDLTATATDPMGDTSEFSHSFHVPAATTTHLGGPESGATVSDPVLFVGTVNADVVTFSSTPGTITILEDGTPVANSPFDVTFGSDIFHVFVDGISAGVHTFVVEYSGSPDLLGSESAPVTITVTPSTTPPGDISIDPVPTFLTTTTTTTFGASPAAPVAGQPLTLTATVTGPPGTATDGPVTFYAGGQAIGSAPLDASGHASIVIAAPAGTTTLSAAYSGSATFASGSSTALAVTAVQASPALVLLGPSNLSVAGQTLPFVAAVVPAGGVTPTGFVIFAEAGVVLAIVPLDASGHASFVTSTLAPGPHVIAAAYLGDTSDAPALSNYVAQGVLAPSRPVVVAAHFRTAPHAPTAIVLDFGGPTPSGPSRYGIVGPDGRAVAVASASYDPATRSVALATSRRIDPRRSYRITLDGQPAGTLTPRGLVAR